MADRIRTVAMAGLCGCMESACADRAFRSFVSIGPNIQDPLGDSLIVHLTEAGPTSGSTTRGGNMLPFAVHTADFEVQLRDNGWPQISTDDMSKSIVVPDSDMVNGMALHSMGHGEKMYRALVDAIQRKELFAGASNGHIGLVQISRLRPIQPTSFMVGWSCTVQVEATLR
jgi:hypothetical protein